MNKLKVRNLLISLLLSFVFSNYTFGQSIYTSSFNSETPAVYNVFIPTSNEIVRAKISKETEFARIHMAIQPLALGYSDGKGLLITDVDGEVIFFALDDTQQISIWDESIVSTYNNISIVAGETYEFILYVRPTGISVYLVGSSSISEIMNYSVQLKSPLSFELVAQRTGASFKNVTFYRYVDF